ncbi:putative monooxygenase YcnE [compost metagenome]
MHINITAIIKSVPSKAEEMKAILEELAIESNKEEACLQYDLHQDIDEPNVFIFYEIWKDGTSLDIHNNSVHVLKFKEASEAILLETPAIYITNRIK